MFANGNLEEKVYVDTEGFVSPGQEHLVCKLKKSIYGLKQSPRCWNSALDAYQKQTGFTQSNSDPCIHFKDAGGEKVYVSVYVDDVLAARTNEVLHQVKSDLPNEFDIEDKGKLSYFLGMSIIQDDNSKSGLVNQEKQYPNKMAGILVSVLESPSHSDTEVWYPTACVYMHARQRSPARGCSVDSKAVYWWLLSHLLASPESW